MERLTKATDDLSFLCDHLRRETKFDAQRVKDIHDRLAAYEDTGLTPEEITQMRDDIESRFLVYVQKHYGISSARLRELAEADNAGLLEVKPCKVGDTVFTIEENYFDCENCEHRDEAILDPQQGRLSCEFPEDRHCPYFIKEHVTEGFNVGSGGISGPGEWGYEGLERFTGIDAGWYPTREDAAAAKAALEAHHV